jgi:hypothetical protein
MYNAITGTFLGLKDVVAVMYYSLVLDNFVECLLQPCLWSSPWQNCLTNFMVEIKTLEF